MGSKIVLYKGKRGAGKTLTLVKDGLQYYLNGWRVLTNMSSMKFGEYISEDDIMKINKESDISNCVIVMDELQIFFDSRRSMKNQNLKFSNFIQQVRKRNIILLGTTQFSNTIDLRLRQHVDIVGYPKFKEKYPVCEVRYIDMTAIEDDVLGSIEEPSYLDVVYNPIPIFNLFETEEMIK